MLAHVGGSVVHPIFRGVPCGRVGEVFRNNNPIVVKDRINGVLYGVSRPPVTRIAFDAMVEAAEYFALSGKTYFSCSM